MPRISIKPLTRLMGHGKVDIFLNDAGEVINAYFQVPELTGFERFCEGRPIEELARITTRICGICPEAHHLASAKALDAAFQVQPPGAAVKLRELLYSAFYIDSHATHFYFLAGPDFMAGPEASPLERNFLGALARVGQELASTVIRHRAAVREAITIIGGRAMHPVFCLPGGVSKHLSEEERRRVEQIAQSSVEFARSSLRTFRDVVLDNKAYVDMMVSQAYSAQTYYMGLVDADNRVNFYEGLIRVVDPEGDEFATFAPARYLDHIAERVEGWSYLKFAYLKGVGWKGLVDGKGSGVYRVGPLARLNAAAGMATSLAQTEYERMYEALGGKPVHFTLAYHWARLIELLYAAERMLELSRDPEITSSHIRTIPTASPAEGVGVVEAPRGTLFHHYEADDRGLVRRLNLIVGTGNNNAAICISVRDAARGVVKAGRPVDSGALNRIEMAIRAYDPCLSCATHSLSGHMPLEINLYDSGGCLIQRVGWASEGR